MRKKSKIKDIIIVILSLIVLGDFFFNDKLLLTKFSEGVTNVGEKAGRKIGEWYVDTIIKDK